MHAWRIWYGDGSVREGLYAHEWEAAPDRGVQFVEVDKGRDAFGRRLSDTYCGCDWYWLHDDTIGANRVNSPDRGVWAPCEAPAGAFIKAGEWIDDDKFAPIEAAFVRGLQLG